jgi:CheY-like chemotaxis protein
MSMIKNSKQAAENIGKELPFLRRYGRALSGNQAHGDDFAAATLEHILHVSDALESDASLKVTMFRIFQEIWTDSKASVLVDEDAPLAVRAQEHLAVLKSGSRDALLLSSLEQFAIEDVSTIMQKDVEVVRRLLDEAYSGMAETLAGRVLIIEDDALIADDIETIVSGMGHEVTGNADTHAAAVEMALEDEPDLILADVVLADDTSGAEAAREIMSAYNDKPVIFITGHPERLLTGERPEPAFLIPKPYMHDQVRTAVSQALFFASSSLMAESDDA